MKRLFILGITSLFSISSFTQIIDTGDKVGVGAGDPKEKLEVEGTGRYVTTNTGLNYLIKIGGSTHLKDNAVGIGFDPEGYNDAYLNRIKTAIVVEGDASGWSRGNLHVLQANNSENIPATISDAVFTITRFGQVGIGTTTPDAELAVNGIIHTKEIKVDLTGWSDFVFEDNYKLKSIEEIEQFIIENKHLPDIPNKSEVVDNGINLGEMDAKLLQKIEELTLYLIEQNKRIEKLEKENQILQNKIHIIE